MATEETNVNTTTEVGFAKKRKAPIPLDGSIKSKNVIERDRDKIQDDDDTNTQRSLSYHHCTLLVEKIEELIVVALELKSECEAERKKHAPIEEISSSAKEILEIMGSMELAKKCLGDHFEEGLLFEKWERKDAALNDLHRIYNGPFIFGFRGGAIIAHGLQQEDVKKQIEGHGLKTRDVYIGNYPRSQFNYKAHLRRFCISDLDRNQAVNAGERCSGSASDIKVACAFDFNHPDVPTDQRFDGFKRLMMDFDTGADFTTIPWQVMVDMLQAWRAEVTKYENGQRSDVPQSLDVAHDYDLNKITVSNSNPLIEGDE
eukprot:TRINITY_DN6479_c0_g1_i3.p1 TRINITY_DN6479_c0_g1~~TRINITY_DN6479_c0_g1_i3.p1  ORF type:complete len:316 (+),score=66.45 TRINITY_DN6479_c0_g1_i3:43-990(+)